ncbi:TetR/AcrR family transcriptional regulator [Streptomyces morookaense]|uniref:TetR/AcrR family transcriptional regulator n=1 Tax=Streptomyces morookaense TaxID=1970 RepID=A0A7Y7B7X6_STRMO|nr:TetR/AcrR family transcriptional regulator [Streptomyces morookaense]NVK80677.1 TetR/AcrR family transcriptional regulator [Streptomyces morookaense]GHF12611.1 TetR family transcriptional regulator [Streptomyces morookaense]
MGHREDLLEGAKRCLLDKGWVRTTARDIVAASGANLASIGYHYGSKEALMLAAFMKMTEEWGESVGHSLQGVVPSGASADERNAATWDAVIEGFSVNRQFWQVQMEVVGQLEQHPELKKTFAEVLPSGREGMVAIFEGVDDTEVGAEATRTVGSLYHALFIGLWVQWLIDPAAVPTGRDIVEGMHRVLEGRVLDPADTPSGAVSDN